MATEAEIVSSVGDGLLSRRKRDLVSKALRYLADERKLLAGLAGLSIVAAQVESMVLVLIAVVADGAASGGDTAQLILGPLDLQLPIWTAASLTAVGIVVTAALVLTNGYLAAKTFARLERASRDEIVTRHATADWEYQATEKSSRLQGRLLRLMDARATAFVGLVMWSRALATIVVFVVVAAVMSPVAAAVIVTFGVMLSLAMLPIRRIVVRLGARSANEEVGLAADVAEAVDHGADVHVFRAWPSFLRRFDSKSHSLQGVRSRIGIAKNLTPVVFQYGALALILVILIIAVLLSSEGQLGPVAAAALLLLRSVQYGQQLQQSLQQIAEAVPRIELLDRQLSIPPPKLTPGDATIDGISRLELRDVYYTYPGGEGPALKGVSLSLRPGRIVGVAGPSGSGKSTLAQVLLRLRWPDSGDYLVNGRSAADFSMESWSGVVSHVPQQPRLLHGTLAENVGFLDESITPEAVRRTLDSVGLDEFVRALPHGIDTEVGPTGRSLSGGQVQRLGIARALVREPRLVVLDEPTSALDVNAERVVGDALVALRGRPDMLVIIIAHRPSTLALCDEIVVLHDGVVAEDGTPDELAADGDFLKVMRDLAPLGRSDGGS